MNSLNNYSNIKLIEVCIFSPVLAGVFVRLEFRYFLFLRIDYFCVQFIDLIKKIVLNLFKNNFFSFLC